MNKASVLIAVIAAVVTVAVGSASADVTHYWNALDNPANYDSINSAIIDLVDSINATRTGDIGHWPMAWSSGADGTASGAAQVCADSANCVGWSPAITDLGTTFTYEMMFQWVGYGNGTWQYFGNRAYGAGNTPVTIYRNGNGNMYVTIGANYNVINAVPAPGFSADSTWYDMTVTADGSNLNLYITPYSPTATAQLIASVPFSGSSASTGNLSMGNCDASKYGVSGWLDWGATWNTALSADDITGNIRRNGPVLSLTANLTIKKFFDCDNNGQKDYSDDNLLPNWEYHITGPGGYDQTLTTDGTGQIALTGLDAGNYTVTETVKQDHTITTGNQGVVIALAAGDDKTELFGNVLPGDINQDELVDSVDFTILKANYGLSPKTWVQGNLNPLEDTLVDSIDFTILKAYFGKGVPPGPGAVPEPASAVLVILGLAGMVLRRRAR